jgi:hypothetical protein
VVRRRGAFLLFSFPFRLLLSLLSSFCGSFILFLDAEPFLFIFLWGGGLLGLFPYKSLGRSFTSFAMPARRDPNFLGATILRYGALFFSRFFSSFTPSSRVACGSFYFSSSSSCVFLILFYFFSRTPPLYPDARGRRRRRVMMTIGISTLLVGWRPSNNTRTSGPGADLLEG